MAMLYSCCWCCRCCCIEWQKQCARKGWRRPLPEEGHQGRSLSPDNQPRKRYFYRCCSLWRLWEIGSSLEQYYTNNFSMHTTSCETTQRSPDLMPEEITQPENEKFEHNFLLVVFYSLIRMNQPQWPVPKLPSNCSSWTTEVSYISEVRALVLSYASISHETRRSCPPPQR